MTQDNTLPAGDITQIQHENAAKAKRVLALGITSGGVYVPLKVDASGSVFADYLKLDGTNVPTANYSWTTNLTTTGYGWFNNYVLSHAIYIYDPDAANFESITRLNIADGGQTVFSNPYGVKVESLIINDNLTFASNQIYSLLADSIIISEETLSIGTGAVGIDYKLNFEGENSQGVITYDETNAKFLFDKGIKVNLPNTYFEVVEMDLLTGSWKIAELITTTSTAGYGSIRNGLYIRGADLDPIIVFSEAYTTTGVDDDYAAINYIRASDRLDFINATGGYTFDEAVSMDKGLTVNAGGNSVTGNHLIIKGTGTIPPTFRGGEIELLYNTTSTAGYIYAAGTYLSFSDVEQTAFADRGNAYIKLDTGEAAFGSSRFVKGGVGNLVDSSYTLSVQTIEGDTLIEMINDGGTGKGAFFGLNDGGGANGLGDYFTIANYQGGPIKFYTDTTASSSVLRYEMGADGVHKFGDGVWTNYLAISATGDLTLYGTADTIDTIDKDLLIDCGAAKTMKLVEEVFDDVQFGISNAKVPAANAPVWQTFTTNTNEYGFGVDDLIDCEANELPHWWAQGTNGRPHLHVTTKGANASGVNQYAKFTVVFAYADADEVWVESSFTAELTIPTGTLALTNFFLDMGADLALANYLIGAQVKVRVERIDATSGDPTEYPGEIFITQVGLHLAKDTMGSRQLLVK